MTGTPKSPDELVDLYEALINKYPAIVALINPLRKEVRCVGHLRQNVDVKIQVQHDLFLFVIWYALTRG